MIFYNKHTSVQFALFNWPHNKLAKRPSSCPTNSVTAPKGTQNTDPNQGNSPTGLIHSLSTTESLRKAALVLLCWLFNASRLPYNYNIIDWSAVLRPTPHKISHFGDIPQANLLAWYGKTKFNTTKAHIHQSKETYYNTK